ncbi:glutaredoxin-1 [Tetranychus urticae]|uniref:Glutaredoxin domain-containing protein n=1 Tax=Tetranychus urticae TaxID=32264 RepID=T1KBC2_TETUR|nr:glutaredoxin-1 [Tetranychus urticae]
MGLKVSQHQIPIVSDEENKQFVDSTINSAKVVIFSKTYCPSSESAKKVLSNYPIKSDQYQVIELDNNPNSNIIQNYLKLITGAKTVPRVFICGRCIGGGDETIALDKCGDLVKLLAECEALQ